MVGNAFLHTVRYFMGLDEPHTQTTQAEQQALQKYCEGCRRAVEIGVYEGANTRILAENLATDGCLFAIDPFFAGRLPICWGEQIAKAEVRHGEVRERVRFVRALSWEAAEQIEGPFDFVFIDGDHSFEGFRRDWNDWSDRVEAEGIIALHDTRVPEHNPNVTNLGSYRYFEDRVRNDERFQIIEQVDSLSVLKRR